MSQRSESELLNQDDEELDYELDEDEEDALLNVRSDQDTIQGGGGDDLNVTQDKDESRTDRFTKERVNIESDEPIKKKFIKNNDNFTQRPKRKPYMFKRNFNRNNLQNNKARPLVEPWLKQQNKNYNGPALISQNLSFKNQLEAQQLGTIAFLSKLFYVQQLQRSSLQSQPLSSVYHQKSLTSPLYKQTHQLKLNFEPPNEIRNANCTISPKVEPLLSPNNCCRQTFNDNISNITMNVPDNTLISMRPGKRQNIVKKSKEATITSINNNDREEGIEIKIENTIPSVDPEYERAMEQQKLLREQVLRWKEERRIAAQTKQNSATNNENALSKQCSPVNDKVDDKTISTLLEKRVIVKNSSPPTIMVERNLETGHKKISIKKINDIKIKVR